MAQSSCLTSSSTTVSPSPTTATVVGEAPSQASPPAMLNPHVCTSCDKAFPTHQALGGHKTCHRSKPPAAATDEASSDRIHRCATCGETFKTGQALGGHMRKHYAGRVIIKRNGAKKSPVNSSYGGAASHSGGGSLAPPDSDSPLPEYPGLDLTLKL